MSWWPGFLTFKNNYSVDEDFDAMTAPYSLLDQAESYSASYEDLTILDMFDSYPGMSGLETMVIMDMYSGFVDPLVDWWTLSDNEKQQLAEAYWLQYLDDTAEIY